MITTGMRRVQLFIMLRVAHPLRVVEVVNRAAPGSILTLEHLFPSSIRTQDAKIGEESTFNGRINENHFLNMSIPSFQI